MLIETVGTSICITLKAAVHAKSHPLTCLLKLAKVYERRAHVLHCESFTAQVARVMRRLREVVPFRFTCALRTQWRGFKVCAPLKC